MTAYRLRAPVLLIVFNRPDLVRQVLDALRTVQPSRLYVAADGPRPGHPDDPARTAAVRDLVSTVDWPCTVQTRFADENRGCKYGVTDAISWFFAHEPEGIILEDDILPSLKAFAYWDWGLDACRKQEQVFLIPGMSFRAIPQSTPRCSRLVPIWGWATWRRAWAHYDPVMSGWATNKHLINRATFGKAAEYVYRTYERYDPINDNAWDIPWSWSVLQAGGCCVLPPFPLIDNIGFGPDATHTTGVNRHGVASELYAERQVEHVLPDWRVDAREDERYLIKQYGADRPMRRIKSFVRRFVKPTPVT